MLSLRDYSALVQHNQTILQPPYAYYNDVPMLDQPYSYYCVCQAWGNLAIDYRFLIIVIIILVSKSQWNTLLK